MSEDPETIGLRPMVIDGRVQAEHFEVVWRGLSIGRILKQPHTRHWWWGFYVYGQNPKPGDSGVAIDLRDSQARFKLAWAKIRPTLTEQDIAIAAQHAESIAQQRQSERPQLEVPLQVLDNLRAAPRRRLLKSGIIEFNGGTHRLRHTKHVRHGRGARRGESGRHSVGIQSAPVWNALASTMSSGLA